MEDGSGFEDDRDKDAGGKRSLNHFYDPLTGLGLSETFFGKASSPLGDNSFTWASVSNCPGINLTVPSNPHPINERTWQNARGYEWLGLTATSLLDRHTNLTEMFRSVGQVMHLLQDTSQPQHVRNEQHLDSWWEGGLNTPWRSHIEDYYKGKGHSLNYQHSMLDWKGDGFTKLEDFWNRHLYNGNGSALIADAGGNPSSQLGLAEFSNGNFLGERHLYPEYFKNGDIEYYPFPSRDHSTDYLDQRDGLLACLYKTDTLTLKNGHQGKAIYVKKVTDGAQVNHLSRFTFFGAQFPRFGMMTINDDNVLHDYHDKLIPKAVEYSAGLLDYFFRGTLGVGVSNVSSGTYTLQITNTSGQDFKDGSFRLLYDRANGTRTELTGLYFSTTYSGALAANASISGVFDAPSDAVKYILIYKGTIGTTGGAASDPVDAGIAIAAKTFAVTAPQCVVSITKIPSPPTVYDYNYGMWATNTSSFTMPAVGGTVTVPIYQRGQYTDRPNINDLIIGEGDIVSGAGEFRVVGYTTYPDSETLTLQNKGLTSNVSPGTAVPAGQEIEFREDLEPWKAVYVPSVNRIFVNASWDTILVVNPATMTIESDFHVSNLIDDYSPSLVYAADVDRLYLFSSYGGVYVINPHTCKVDSVISFSAAFWIDSYDGFYDPINHQVGFGYSDYTSTGLLLIKTFDNSIAADIAGIEYDVASAAEYSAVDNQIYVGGSGNILVYSATNYNLIATLYTSLYSIEQLRYCSATSEIYGYGRQSYHYGDGIGFYIDPLGSITNSTTGDFTAPTIGANVTVATGDTSGMIAGRSVKIDGVDWMIVAMDSKNQFEAGNLTVSPGTVVAAGKSVTWGGPKLKNLPAVGNVVGLLYSASSERIIFEGTRTKVSSVFDPIIKIVDCIIPNPDGEDYNYGCEGPDGILFVPFFGANYNSGFQVWK